MFLKKKTWGIAKENILEHRNFYIKTFNERIQQYVWNQDITVKILPLVYSTTYDIAKSICSNGFSTLSFGK